MNVNNFCISVHNMTFADLCSCWSAEFMAYCRGVDKISGDSGKLSYPCYILVHRKKLAEPHLTIPLQPVPMYLRRTIVDHLQSQFALVTRYLNHKLAELRALLHFFKQSIDGVEIKAMTYIRNCWFCFCFPDELNHVCKFFS